MILSEVSMSTSDKLNNFHSFLLSAHDIFWLTRVTANDNQILFNPTSELWRRPLVDHTVPRLKNI